MLQAQFPDLDERQHDRIYFECINNRLTTSKEVWEYCVERGYFNGQIVVLVEEQPRLASTDSLRECVREYDKITPLISSFRKSLAVRGSTVLAEREQQLKISSKLWASEVT